MGSWEPRLEAIDILLVDDRTGNLIALAAALSSPNYNLILKNSGREALRYLLDHEPAVILIDVQMPELDGFETVALIKRSERTREIPIIFLTAVNLDEELVQKGYEYGAVDYIHKPLDTRILKSKVAIFAELARKTQRLLQTEKRLRENEVQERERLIAQLELKSLKRKQLDQKKFIDLVEGINHGIVWSADPVRLQISFISSNAERILGYPLEQWSSADGSFLSCIHPEDSEEFLQAVRKVQVNKRDLSLEHRVITASRQMIWMHTGIRVAEPEEGSGCEIRGLSVDITRTKNVEMILLKNKKRSDFLAEASLLLSGSLDYEVTLFSLGSLVVPRLADWFVIHVLDERGQIKTLSLAHSDPDKVKLVRELTERYPLNPKAENGVPRVLRSGKPELYSEITEDLLRKTAVSEELLPSLKELDLKSAMTVPLIARSKILGTMTFIVDQSGSHDRYTDADLSMAEDLALRAATAIDNANLYRQAQSAIRVRDEFLSIASHELKTPLTPLKLQTQGLMRALKSESAVTLKQEKIEKMVEVSDRQIGRLSRLIDDLLDISRISNGKLSLNREEFDLIALIRDVAERFSDQLARAECSLELNAAIPSLFMQGDPFRLEQVVINLLTNAIKYGPAQPIRIAVQRQDEGHVRLLFQDHGIGIAKEDQKRIFERFERAVSESHFGGLGLGLYIVAQIIEAHEGTITVRSKLGAGSTFTLTLPVHADLKSEVPPSLAQRASRHGAVIQDAPPQ